MVVMAWVLLIIFGLVLSSMFSQGLLEGGSFVAFIFTAFIVALSAGVIWGGLFQ